MMMMRGSLKQSQNRPAELLPGYLWGGGGDVMLGRMTDERRDECAGQQRMEREGEGMDRMGHIVFGSRGLDSIHSCDLVTPFSESPV